MIVKDPGQVSVRVGWRGGCCGVQSFHGLGALQRAYETYREEFKHVAATPEAMAAEAARINARHICNATLTGHPCTCGLFVFEVA